MTHNLWPWYYQNDRKKTEIFDIHIQKNNDFRPQEVSKSAIETINLSIVFKLFICTIDLNADYFTHYLKDYLFIIKIKSNHFFSIHSMSQYLKFDAEVYNSLHAHVTKEENDQLIIEARDPGRIFRTGSCDRPRSYYDSFRESNGPCLMDPWSKQKLFSLFGLFHFVYYWVRWSQCYWWNQKFNSHITN